MKSQVKNRIVWPHARLNKLDFEIKRRGKNRLKSNRKVKVRENNQPERGSNLRPLTLYVGALPTELSGRYEIESIGQGLMFNHETSINSPLSPCMQNCLFMGVEQQVVLILYCLLLRHLKLLIYVAVQNYLLFLY